MNIRQTIITATVGLTMAALIAPGVAGAITAADLQAQINMLLAQLQQLQGSTTTGSMPAACVGITFSRNLTTGSVGSDVKCLQVILNMSASTQVSASGAGAPGYETTTFGPKTLVAVRKFQTANGITPASQVGPLTRAKLNAWLGGSSPITPTPGQPPVVTPTGAGLWVSLASDTPATNAVVKTAALVPLEKITFHNGDNAQVKVTSVKLHRIGVSADASLNNIYLFDGANRLTDAASVASSVISFNDSNGIFMVDSNGTKTITVYADLAANAGETLGTSLMMASDVTSNSSSVNGSFPVNGNLMNVATATLAGVDFSNTTTPSATSINPMKDTVVWENLTSITTRSVTLNWLRFREIGTINYSDLQNFRLYVDGVKVGNAVQSLDANGYVTFDLSGSPVALQTGTRDIRVLADVIGGSNRTFTMSLRVAADASFTDSQYGSHVLATYNTGTAFAARTSGTQTINSGSITVQKTADSPAGNITSLASNQVLGRFTLTAAGEKVKVDTLTVGIITSDATVGCLRNGALFANGIQIGSTADLPTTTNAGSNSCGSTGTSKAFSLGSSLMVDPLTPVTVEIRGDIYDNDGTNGLGTGDTLQSELLVGSSNGQGQVSLTTSNVPTATLTANQLTVKVGSLTLAKYTAYTNQNSVPPVSNLKLAHFTLNNDTVEPINITSIETDLNYVSGNTTNLYVQYGTQQTSKIATPSAANTQSVFYQLAPGATIDVMAFGDINSNAAGVARTGIYVAGTTVNSATSVTAGTSGDNTTGQTITFTTGSVTSGNDAGMPLAQVVAGNKDVIAAKYKVTASNDSFTIQEVKVSVASAAISAIANSASLWDGTTLLSTQPFNQTSNTVAYFTGLSVPVAANTSKVLTVSLNLATPYTDGTTITTGRNAKVTMTYLKAANSQGVQSTPSTSNAGNDVYVFKSIPTVTSMSLPSGQASLLSSGSTTSLYHLQVAADAKGPVYVKQLKFTVTPNNTDSSTAIPSFNTFKFFKGSQDITSSVTIQNASGTSLESTTTSIASNTSSKVVVVTFDTEEGIAAGTSYDYTLKATPASFTTSTSGNDSVSTVVSTDSVFSGISSTVSGYLASAGPSDSAVAALATSANQTSGTAANFIWSDNSAQVHNYAQGTSNSADWFNGYEVLNLPLDAAGIVAG